MKSSSPSRSVEGVYAADVFPLTRAQEAHWYLRQLKEDLNAVWWIDLRGPLRLPVLEGALAALIRRQEILRTTFLATDGAPCQRIRRPWAPDVPILDLQALGSTGQQGALRACETRAAALALPLARLPLLRWLLLRTGPHRHLLLMTFPRILLDSSSRELLIRSLAVAGEEAGREEAGREEASPGVQCSDVAALQALTFEPPSHRREAAAGSPFQLPLDRVPVRRGPGERLRFPLAGLPVPPAALGRRRALGGQAFQRQAWGQRSWYAALFGLLLARWAGRETIAFEVVVDLREAFGAEDLLGPLTEQLALAFDVPTSQTVAALHRVVKVAFAEQVGYQNQRHGRRASWPSVADWETGAVLEVTPAFAKHSFQGLELEALNAGRDSSPAERGAVFLRLQTTEEGAALGFLEIEGALLDRTTGERLCLRFAHLARRAAADPNGELSHLTTLTPAEHHQIVHEWRGESQELSVWPLHRCFEEMARQNPQAPAVRFSGGELSFRELSFREVEEQAGALARWLRALGVGEGCRVGICVEQQPALAVAMVGILKAGAAYLQLDCRHPMGRLGAVMSKAQLNALVSEDCLLDRLPRHSLPTVCIDPARPTLGGGRTSWPAPPAAPAMVSVSFIEGPGLEVVTYSHRAVACWARSAAPLGAPPSQGIAVVAGLSSELCTMTAWTAWLVGGWWAAAPVPEGPSREVHGHGAATYHLSPEAMLQGVAPRGETVVLGAGPDLESWVEAIDGRWPSGRCTAVYGCPQGSPLAGAWRVSPGGRSPVPPLGSLHVLDRGLRPCGIGTAGSLWIGEGGLPSHVDNDPRGTAERLRPDPFSERSGGRMFGTLDRGRISAAGVLELLGREDRQVKVAGARVEPAEIEGCLVAHPEVAECSVVSTGEPGEKPHLVAFVVKGPTIEAPARASIPPKPEEETPFFEEACLEETLGRILRSRPRSILEVGGDDRTLTRFLAPLAERYLVKVRLGGLGRLGSTREVEGIERRLEDFGGLEGSFDAVILGPWIQDLPSVELLLRILDGAASALQPGGKIFLVGVSNERLRTLRHLRRTLASAAEDLPARALLRRLRAACDDDGELSLSPAFFGALRSSRDWLRAVWILPLRPSAAGRASVYRFDAVLEVATPPEGERGSPDTVWREWAHCGLTMESLRSHLQREEPESLGFTGVPYGSLQRDLEALEALEGSSPNAQTRVADILRLRDDGRNRGVNPEDFWSLGQDLPYRAEVSWARSGRSGSFDVLLQRCSPSEDESSWPKMPAPERRGDPAAWFARQPLLGTAADRFGRRLERFLARRLPAHLVPRTIVVVPTLPSLESEPRMGGDRLLLDSQEEPPPPPGPATSTEEVVAGIWGELLGITDPAVALGVPPASGGLVLATRLAAHLNRSFHIEIPADQVLRAGALQEVASLVDALLVERLRELGGDSSGSGLGGIRAVDGDRE